MSAETLLKDYFVRDLSEVEDETLAQALQNSPELAEQFAQAAEQDYVRLTAARPKRDRGFPWRIATVVVAAGGLLWWSQAGKQPVPESKVVVEDETPFAQVGEKAAPIHQPEYPKPASELAPTEVPELVVQAVAGPARRFNILLAAARSQTALLVLDSRGAMVRRLAPSQVGRWIWDGRDAQGRDLPPGLYHFEVALGSKVLGQWVQIESRD